MKQFVAFNKYLSLRQAIYWYCTLILDSVVIKLLSSCLLMSGASYRSMHIAGYRTMQQSVSTVIVSDFRHTLYIPK